MPVWLQVEASQRTRLKAGRREPRLGISTLLGIAVRDVQHKFRVELGPMPLNMYNRFLPDGDLLTKLRDWVRSYVGIEFIWDLRLILEHGHTAHARIGSPQKLGLNTWLRVPRSAPQAESRQLVLTPEPLDRVVLRHPAGSRPLN
jgi:type VI secretion system protein ImpH